MIMIVNPGTTVVVQNLTTVDPEDGLKTVIATAKTREKAAVANSATAAADIHQARAASIKVGRVIMKAGNAIAVTAKARTKATM